ncbi:hypothetical protein ES703_64703 [subsurface metagenome]
MSTAIDELTSQVMALPPDERALLAQRLWDCLQDFVNPEIEKAFLEEAKKRWHEIEEGKVQCIPAKEVMKEARASLNKRL